MTRQKSPAHANATYAEESRTKGGEPMRSAGSNGLRGIDPSDLPVFEVLGVRVHHVSPEQALSAMEFMIGNGSPHHVVTVNPEFIMQAQRNLAFRDVLNAASLSVPDGIGIVGAALLNGIRNVQRVTGVDTVERLAAVAASRGYRFFLLGSAPGVAERAAAVLRQRNPGLNIAGTFSGSPRPEEDEDIVARVKATQPDVLMVAYGTPSQETWISRNLNRLDVPVCIGVGGTFDFIAGEIPRAPRWMQNTGTEWFYRLIVQPSRWRRMLDLPRFALRVLKSRT